NVGTVLDIQLFSTIIQTVDNKKIIIPNGKITGDIITNNTVLASRRLDIPFMVNPAMDLEKVRAVIRQVLDSDERVLKSPAYDMIVAEWGDAVKLVVRPFVQPKDYDHVQSDLIEKINLVLRAMA
ncbi:MAG TPA: mechanosensitive ion channel, partial [Candidatus Cloacimonadota bacterium]|nr:mechanosensitive ion channel [Candidatus Cloacimonadota bacterium]